MSTGPSTAIITLPGCTSPWHTTTVVELAANRRAARSPPAVRRGPRRRCRHRPRRSTRRSPTTRTTRAGERIGRGSRATIERMDDPDHRSDAAASRSVAPDGTTRSQHVTDSSPDVDRTETAGLCHPQTLIGQVRGQLDRRTRRAPTVRSPAAPDRPSRSRGRVDRVHPDAEQSRLVETASGVPPRSPPRRPQHGR